MKSFLIANPKGGVGKSTLATNLAGYFARRNYRVMLGDIDRQQSAREWLKLRPPSLPPIATWEIDPDKPARPPEGTTHKIARCLPLSSSTSVFTANTPSPTASSASMMPWAVPPAMACRPWR
jgi:cellulose biosynthesis protein BcsQ